MIIVYMRYVVWEEIGDVLHGLGEDRGWTSKSKLFSIDTAVQCVSYVKYGSVFVRWIQH